ncbi:protein YLS3 [Selaginella moellendorffii]|uniref:protein YLS3 n=1 Tax=Selaginella moellendorffii TaxID=88036 RepID=UPI000D1CAC09|nr:protein YLS3 [Selaginella moellendorffii]|eukprot:XP_024539788.1 protein YLS3 [Selaginella moellendorffii]
MNRRAAVAVAAILCCSILLLRASASLPPGTECIPILTELEPCLPFVQYSGEKPTAVCCSVLRDVHNKSAPCLCRLIASEKNQPPTPGINLTLAFLLPDACHLKVNPDRCPALLRGDPSWSTQPEGGSNSGTADLSAPVIDLSSSAAAAWQRRQRWWSSGVAAAAFVVLRV